MALMKILKTPAFFKRYQVPKRRRRQGKTDYGARRLMVRNDKNKYNAKKHRLVVRVTNRRIITQIVYATILGDRCVCAADSTELAKYGIPAGYKNYSAAYATGLLIGRRMLKKYGMDGDFKGKEEIDGDEYHVEEEEGETESRPFKVILDVGIRTTSVGVRIWGALKGAVDAGLHVPHKIKNFPGYTEPNERGGEPTYEAEAHKGKIFGEHLSEYMSSMAEEDPTKYEAHFAKYIEAGKSADDIEEMYGEAHTKIREDPSPATKVDKGITWTRIDCADTQGSDGKASVARNKKIGLEARRAKVLEKISAAQERAAAAAEEEEEEE